MPLQVERTAGQGSCHLRLNGRLDEHFTAEQLGALSPVVLLDTGDVRTVSSAGVRQWSRFIDSTRDKKLYLLRCSSSVVNQLNLVVNFAGHSKVLSVMAPYFCPKCLLEQEVVVEVLRHGALLRSGAVPPASCSKCGGTMLFDDPSFFRFVARLGAKEVDPACATMLEQLGLFAGSSIASRRLEVSKLIEEQVTLLQLSGDIDERFRASRLATGLEGAVVLVVSQLGITRGGRAPWDQFLMMLEQQCSEVVLADVPAPMIEAYEQDKIELGRSCIHTVLAPLFCSSCHDLSTERVVAATLVQRSDGVARCPRCGHRMDLVADALPLGKVRANHRPPPPALAAIADRSTGLFSSARIEATLSAEPAQGERTEVGPYKIIRPLSDGGMAQIYLATRPGVGGFEKPMALKVFRRELLDVARGTVQMFLSEAKLCANLNHPNIIQLFDVGEAGGDLYIAMEYIYGSDLRSLSRKQRLPLGMLASVGVQIASALEHAHHAADPLTGKPLNIVHRDVSPQNVLLGIEGQVKLIDFGIALAGKELAKKRDTVAGNVSYMSPEQCRGEPLDGRSDVFALGVVLWEQLSGKRLFRRETLEQTMAAVLGATIPPLPEAPPSVSQVVMRALERDRKRRYQSAEELSAALRDSVADFGGLVSTADIGAFVRTLVASGVTAAPEEPPLDAATVRARTVTPAAPRRVREAAELLSSQSPPRSLAGSVTPVPAAKDPPRRNAKARIVLIAAIPVLLAILAVVLIFY
jgi:hypothetical protein